MHDDPRTSFEELKSFLTEARTRTLDLVRDLDDDQLLGPRLAIVNPLLWEMGHVAWFQENWVLRHLRGLAPVRADGDALYDSAKVAHDTRWDLPLPSRAETLRYMQTILERSLELLSADGVSPRLAYFYRLATFHEDMHAEAFVYTRQTLGYPSPGGASRAAGSETPPAPVPRLYVDRFRGWANVPGGKFLLGGSRAEPFVFDNEKWEHEVVLEPFRIARAVVSNAEFLEFVEDAGYGRRELWDEEGWTWRERESAAHPVYWRRVGPGAWKRRVFDRWRPLEGDLPLIHVNAYEAAAFCRWAGCRLPTEAEWEAAAASEPVRARAQAWPAGTLGDRKRRFPWGDASPTPDRANLDGRVLGVVPVDSHPAGDSACGCRQMLGNVWEWTATPFQPYAGFVADPYKEYSEPWFDGRHSVLRGGCWVTRARLLRNTWRNFYTRDRRDVLAGFRVCALSP